MDCLFNICQILNRNKLPLEKSLEDVLQTLASCLGVEKGMIAILNPITGDIQTEAVYGLSQAEKKRGQYKPGEGVIGRVIAQGEPIIIPCISEAPFFLNKTGAYKESRDAFICVPIKWDKYTMGALSVSLRSSPDKLLKEIFQVLTIISNFIANIVRHIQSLRQEKEKIQQENIELKYKLYGGQNFPYLLGKTSKMQEVFALINKIAKTNTIVLIRGESGTGKELVANAIHYNSLRMGGPFIKINCAALPEELIESELFGHEKGAFTGAERGQPGKFELAKGGTLFLDEIGELNIKTQAKLLRVLQDKEFYRLGGTSPIKVDVRIIAATNQNLEELVKTGRFREDLYYRLNVFPIYLPPLRDRRPDILFLAEYFLKEANQKYNKNIRRISTPAIDLLMQYNWPGNVRELKNYIERAVLLCDEDTIRSYHLPSVLQGKQQPLSLSAAVEQLEREMIVEALKISKGKQTKAAAYLGITLRMLNYKLNKYKIKPEQFKGK